MTGTPHPHLADTVWPAEDGGPARRQRVDMLPGPNATTARLAATRLAPVAVMAIHAPGDRLLVLRNTIGADAVSWVEEIDPESLEPRRRSPDLALGPFWPGGMAVLADGAVVVVQGCWAHRLAPDLTVERSRRLPVEAPYNSFVVLDDGSLATKDLQTETPSTLSVLDPVTLVDRTAPVSMPEACVARLSADGNRLIVVGITALHRIDWDGTTLHAGAPLPYGGHNGQSYGWDPVVEAGAVWWLDNGDHTFANGMTMLGNGVAPGPVHLWRATGEELASVEVCGQPNGAVTNPPIVDTERGVAIAYDSANGVLAAFATETLAPIWSRPLNTSTHLMLYPDTGELVANDFDRATGDSVVVVDITDGAVRTRTPVESPAQSVVFGAPGRHRDSYYVSLSTIARVVFDD